ncbi:MAG: recombinase family protein [Candidatus Eisenbacteria bacterium]
MKRPTKSGNGNGTPPETGPIRCAIYTRKSTEEGLEQEFNSLDAQREAAEAYIASQKGAGWVCLPDRYDDGGYTGANMDRPALKRLLADIESGRVDCVVVYKVDRLSRSLLDFARIIGTLEERRVSFVSVTQAFSTSSSMGRLTMNILLSFAQFEREMISERTRDKMSAARKKGKWIGGMLLLGYERDRQLRRLVVNKQEAERVRAIFDLYLEKESLLEVVKEINRRGWRNKTWTTKKGIEHVGRPFDKATVFGLLRNVTYVGKVNHRGEIYPGEHEAIVEEAVWERVQRLLQRNGRSGGRAARNKYGALLRGLLYCTPCESAMSHCYTTKRGRRYRYYTCCRAQKQGWETCPSKSLPAPEIERFVVERIRAIGSDLDLRAEVLRRLRADADERAEKLAGERPQIEADLRTCSEEIKRLVGSASGNGRRAAVATQLVDLQARTDAAEARLAEIRASQAAVERDRVDEADLARALESFDPVWESLTPQEQARVVELLVERVGYDGERHRVAITFRPGGIKVLAQEVE